MVISTNNTSRCAMKTGWVILAILLAGCIESNPQPSPGTGADVAAAAETGAAPDTRADDAVSDTATDGAALDTAHDTPPPADTFDTTPADALEITPPPDVSDTIDAEDTTPPPDVVDVLEDVSVPCGNAVCDVGENPCSCPEDCPVGAGSAGEACCSAMDCAQPNCGPCCVVQCVSFACTEPIWLDDCCGNGKCEAGEDSASCPADCPADCVKEGMPLGMDETCCPGATELNSSWIAQDGECMGTFCWSPVCANCGDGDCGPGENYCSCPDDCGDLDCVQEGGAAMIELEITDCCDGLTPLPLGDEGCDQYTCIAP